jgi:hypothetical protein
MSSKESAKKEPFTTTSTEAVALIDGLIGSDEAELFQYGYRLFQTEMYRWIAGTLCGYWWAGQDRSVAAQSTADRLRKAIESLDAVERVHVDQFGDDLINECRKMTGVEDEMYVGEIWTIHFKGRVIYDHPRRQS